MKIRKPASSYQQNLAVAQPISIEESTATKRGGINLMSNSELRSFLPAAQKGHPARPQGVRRLRRTFTVRRKEPYD
jgi:hypothetical protein